MQFLSLNIFELIILIITALFLRLTRIRRKAHARGLIPSDLFYLKILDKSPDNLIFL